MSKPKNRLIIVDISSFIFRAFFAIRMLNAPDGTPVNAVHGVMSMLLKLLSKYQPTHIFLARDTKGGSFRNEKYEAYKANRDAPPEELVPQFKLIEDLINNMQLPSCQIENYEADDIIGSAAVQWKDDFEEILIASGDKDLMQFVGDNVKMLDTMKDKIYDKDGVFEKMGVYPEQIVDFLSMLGDTSDNIPGMKGIGKKGAADLLAKHGTLEECIKVKDTFTNKRVKNAFEDYLDDGLLSKELVQIVTDLDLGMAANATEYRFYPTNELVQFLKDLGFKSTVKKVQDMAYNEHQAEQEGEFDIIDSKANNKSFTHHIIHDEKSYKDLMAKLKQAKEVSGHIEYSSADIKEADIISLSLSFDGNDSYFLPFAHQLDMTAKSSNLEGEKLEEVLSLAWSKGKKWISHDCKRDIQYSMLNELPFDCESFDVSQAHFIVDSATKHGIDVLASRYIDHTIIMIEKGGAEVYERPFEFAAEYTGERSNSLFLLSKHFSSEMKMQKLESVYTDIDDPLIPVLAKLELQGLCVNTGFFSELEKEYRNKLDDIEAQVTEASGETINLKSPKQVGELLFEKLGLPVIKKTKTGFSTDSSVLEELDSRELSDVPRLILQYRELDKLLSTYVSVLPTMVSRKTGRIHTSLHQNVAATGRLSSDNPNLQNIPVRSENGRRIRKGFIATPGKLLLAADYSQVELRLLAHFSEDETMIKAFADGVDIHRQTASEVMGIALDKVTSDERSKAKAVNFGLMYGQSSFGLANALRISRGEAKDYITAYFERFHKVKSYLDSLKEYCEVHGYSKTLYGRKRFLPDIRSTNRTVKAMAERVAVNSPIQGTAADIIKIAMINIANELEEKKLQSKMILQVHDELIFEVPENELEFMRDLVKNGMESAASLKVPLDVDMGIGVNWFDLK